MEMELPFEWDDGNFISPFVSSSDGDAAALAEWLVPTHLVQAEDSTAVRWRVTDLGCGDGAALFAIAAHVQQLWQAPSSLQIQALGLDLDDALIDLCHKTKSKVQQQVSSSMVHCDFTFLNEDIRYCSMDVHFPAYTATTASGSDGVREARPLLYLYLLPEALEQLEEQLTDILVRRGYLVACNRWKIAYFAQWECATVGNVTVYQYAKK